VFSSLAAAHMGGHLIGLGFLPFFIIGHAIFWILLVLLIIFAVAGRRRRMARWGAMGWGGPWGHGHGGAGRAAETTLAERFAQGDIDEKEYRARLEVLRANNPTGPTFPEK
jgi:putative membrane protein